jgi:hypothetical protein
MMKRFLVLAACVAANFAMPASAADRFWETDAYKAKAHLFDVASAVFGCHFTLANDSVFRGVNRGVNTRELHNWHLHWHAGNARPAMAINHAQYCADAYKRLGPAGSKEVADVAGKPTPSASLWDAADPYYEALYARQLLRHMQKEKGCKASVDYLRMSSLTTLFRSYDADWDSRIENTAWAVGTITTCNAAREKYGRKGLGLTR